jgi:hypothetical protein
VERCLAVQPVLVAASLAPTLFHARPRACAGGFESAAAAPRASLGPVGLVLDPVGLWSVEELESSTRVLGDDGGRG